MDRPLGIGFLAIIYGITGVFSVLAGLGILFLGMIFPLNLIPALTWNITSLGLLGLAVAIPVATVLLILGFADLVLAYGLWNLRSWAWWLTVIFMLISVLIGLFSMALLSPILLLVGWGFNVLFAFLIPVIVIVYLISVKEEFD